MTEPRVLIVTENASAEFGGEAFIPVHYFRVLRARGIEAFLLTHARVRSELEALFPDDKQRLYFVEDSPAQVAVWQLGRHAPAAVGDFAVDALISMITQRNQRALAKRLVRQLNIDVVHQPTPVSPRLPSAIYDVGAPVIIGPMNGDIRYPPGWNSRANAARSTILSALRHGSEALNYAIVGKRKAALLLVANQRTQQALPDCLRQVPTVQLVENGVDLNRFQSVPARADDGGAVRFVFLGRLVDWKAVDLLVTAFSRVRSEVELHIIGDGPERGGLASLCSRLKIENRVTFHGFVPQNDAAQLLDTMDVLVLPSLRECGGAVVLEAMAKALPVVATEWGGPADYLDDRCGILVKPTGREALIAGLADAMTRLAQDDALRTAMGLAGRQQVENAYDWERKIDTMLDHYRLVIAPQHG